VTEAAFVWVGTGIPRRMHDTRLADLRTADGAPPELEVIAQWLDQLAEQQAVSEDFIPVHPERYGQGLLLTGLPGRGKTTAAAAAACEVRRTGKSVYFTRWADFVQQSRDVYGRLAKDVSSPEELSRTLHALDRVRNSFLVVVDAVGEERVTDTGFGTELLESLLRDRYDDGKPTVVTSNLTSSQWTNRYSGPLRSFISQACRILVFTGRNFRDA
jgi:DNA replication protein DnaC